MTPVNIDVRVQSDEALGRVSGAVSDVQKTMNLLNGTFANYERSLKGILAELNTISRRGAPGQSVRDLQLVAGGTTIAGRVRQSMNQGAISDMKQVEQALVASFVNAQRDILRNVSKSVQSALVRDYASARQSIADTAGNLSAQIEAQRARTAIAAQMSGTRGLNRSRLTQNAESLGISGLGTLRQEKAALDSLLAAEQRITQENATQTRETRALVTMQERLNRLTDERFATLRNQNRLAQLNASMGQQNVNAANAGARGDTMGVATANARREALRLEQMIVSGVKEESAEYQKQLGVIRTLANEKERIRASQAQTLQQTREQTRLEQSRKFASGDPVMRETALNNMMGARSAAGSLEGRASLLGLQSNLLLNYALIGSVTGAIFGMTRAVVDLDTELRQLQAISGATNAEYAVLRDTIIEASTGTKFSAVELAEASTMLAQVGLSAQQIQDTLPAISDFAMAVGTDMKNAVDITTTALTVFNMTTDQTRYVTNVMTEALNRSKLSMDQLVLGFQYSANIVADAGGTFEELTSVLAGMSQAGIRSGSMLGTGLRQIMISLASPTEDLQALLSRLGLSMYDVDVRSQGLVGVLENLRNAGLTAGDAMSVFETRTAAALIAATNQVDFIKQIQEAYAFTSAAEQAAAVQKESLANSTLILKNSFLAFINEAAAPVIKILIDLAQGIRQLMVVATPLAPLFQMLGTTLLVAFGATAIVGVGRLMTTFIGLTGVVRTLSATFVAVRTTMMAVSAAAVVSAAGTTGLTAAMITLRTALMALLLTPVGIFLTGAALAIGAFTLATAKASDGSSKMRQEMDAMQAKVNEAKSEFQRYDDILASIDAALARAKARSVEMKDGSSALHIEVLNGAMQFNQYGANIDATTSKLEPLIAGLGRARVAVLQLRAAQAQQALEESTRQALKTGESLTTAQTRFAANGGVRPLGSGGNTAGARQIDRDLQAAGVGYDERVRILSSVMRLSRGGGANDAGSIANQVSDARVISEALGRIPGLSGNLARVRTNASNVVNAGLTAGAARSNADINASIAESAGLVTTPQFQALSNAVTPTVSAPQIQSQVADIQRRVSAGQLSPADGTRQIQAILSSAGASYRGSRAGYDAAYSRADRFDTPGSRGAFENVMQPAGQALGEIQQTLTGAVQQLDGTFTRLEPSLSSALQNNASVDEVRALAQRGGITDLDNVTNRDEARRILADRKARIANNLTVGDITGQVNPVDQLLYEGQTLAASSRVNAQAARRDAAGREDPEKAARDAKRLSDAAASSFQKLSQAQSTRSDQLLGAITSRTSIDQVNNQIDLATAAFDQADELMQNYFSTKLEGLRAYRAAVASSLSKQELDDLDAEITNTVAQADLSITNMAQEFNDKLITTLQRVPEIGKPFSHLLDTVDKALKALEVELAQALAEVNQIAANREAVGTGMAVAVRQGRIGSTEAAGYDRTYQDRIDSMDASSSASRLANLTSRQAAVRTGLDSQVTIGEGNVVPLRDIERAVDAQRNLLDSLTMGTEEYGLQSARLKDMESVQERLYGLRQQELEVSQQLTAETERQNAMNMIATATIEDRMRNVVSQWANQSGFNVDPVTAMLEKLPGVLDTATNAMSTFFSDVLSGTASIGDAFKSMAVTILDAILQVVTAEMTKMFIKIVMDIGSSMMGGGPSPKKEGGFIKKREGGFLHAANGYGVKGRDSIPILGMPGEYMLRKSAVDAIGVDNLDQINAAGNRAVSGQGAVKPVMIAPQNPGQPLNIYVVSPDQTPPPSRDEIIVMVQDDMINRGAVYKTTRAIQQGAI